jgi:hypothetical protein
MLYSLISSYQTFNCAVSITGFLDFIHCLVFLKEYSVLEIGYVSILRWKFEEYLLSPLEKADLSHFLVDPTE